MRLELCYSPQLVRTVLATLANVHVVDAAISFTFIYYQQRALPACLLVLCMVSFTHIDV